MRSMAFIGRGTRRIRGRKEKEMKGERGRKEVKEDEKGKESEGEGLQ